MVFKLMCEIVKLMVKILWILLQKLVNIWKEVTGMKSREELIQKLENLRASNEAIVASINELTVEMTAAFSRLLAKIAAGGDFTIEFDKVAEVNQSLYDANTTAQNAVSQAKVEGV